MKKIAFFVEGQTEQIFIEWLFRKIVDIKQDALSLHIVLEKFTGKGKPPKSVYPKLQNSPNPTHYILVFDCSNDEGVRHRILEQYPSLISSGYSKVVGLRDLHPRPISELETVENEIYNGKTLKSGKTTPPLPTNAHFIIAVREIEDWFLAECNHYTCINSLLILDTTQVAGLDFHPCTDNLTLRSTAAADDLKKVYQLIVGETYNKSIDKVERTVNCLDFDNIYHNVRHKFPKLDTLISKIDNFLT